jgi:hypothetical protein
VRLRIRVAASVLCMLVVVAVPGSAAAQAHHPRHYRLSINAAPDPTVAGFKVLIYGRLAGPNAGGQTIRLYHHIAGGPPGYQFVTSRTTDSYGFYEIPRADGVVETNRDWFVAGPDGAFSRTLHERVAAQVSLTASAATAVTGQYVTFTGQVSPSHAFQRVLLQNQVGSGDDWRTLTSGLLGPGSSYRIRFRWRTPGERDVRVVLPADARNIRSESDGVDVTIQQKQVTGFTINTSEPVTQVYTPVMISGVITPGPTAQPAVVQLWARPATGGSFAMVGQAPVGSNGAYSFIETPLENTVYQARTAFGAVRASALLWQGVHDYVQMSPSSTTSEVGGTVTFSGFVFPLKAGHAIFLQRLGADGAWHAVEERFVRANYTFQFSWTFAEPGTHVFRARIFSDGRNVGAASAPVTVTVSGLAPVSTLPPSTGS